MTVAGQSVPSTSPLSGRCQVDPTAAPENRIGTEPPRTRAWKDGQVVAEGFPVAAVSDYLDQDGVIVWLDLCAPQRGDLHVVADELSLDPLAVEDAVSRHERAKLDRYPSYLFLNAYDADFDVASGELTAHEISAFICPRAIVTVRSEPGFPVDELLERWDNDRELVRHGAIFLLHGLLDLVVDRHFAAVQSLDGEIEDLEDLLFDDRPHGTEVQRRSYELRKSLVTLRRIVLPMREVVNTLLRRDLHIVPDQLAPYFQDVYDHVLRATEWTESLRDLVTTILEANLTIQGNRLNVIMKKLTGWAAVIAVPTAVTGFYGQNVPYPGFGKEWGFAVSVFVLVGTALGLYLLFKRRDWL